MNNMTTLTSLFLMIITVLSYSSLTSLYKKESQIVTLPQLKPKKAISIAFFISLLILMVYSISSMTPSLKYWFQLETFNLFINFKCDMYSIFFTSVAIFITWAVLEYSSWYMNEDPKLNLFEVYILMFLLAMITITTAGNFFQLFIGWEAVGFMSFKLINWWSARNAANVSAKQAVLYNRIGDLGLLAAMAWCMTTLCTLDFGLIFTAANELNVIFPSLALVLAATGKSAQFGLHPWLPAAMEGPTPVSALLHSSTMVVAGIYLLIRTFPLFQYELIVLSVCLWLGSITSLFAALCALTQFDIKKIVAFSTSSQLGLMMATIGLSQPNLAFMHLCTHAFIKAMLFMACGIVIHALNGEQDIRKMGGMVRVTPLASIALVMGSFALMGTPFLAAFFSKDTIIEAFSTSYINAWALIIILIATAFTAAYSFRLIFYVAAGSPRINYANDMFMDEKLSSVSNPIKRLAFGSITSGFILMSMMYLFDAPVMTMSILIKFAALLVTVLGIIMMVDYTLLNPYPLIYSINSLLKFIIMLGYYNTIVHRMMSQVILKTSKSVATQLFENWLREVTSKLLANSIVFMVMSTIDTRMKYMVKMTFLVAFWLMFSALITLTLW